MQKGFGKKEVWNVRLQVAVEVQKGRGDDCPFFMLLVSQYPCTACSYHLIRKHVNVPFFLICFVFLLKGMCSSMMIN